MKTKVLLSFAALVLTFTGFSQHLYQSSCTAKDSILKLYEKDAARLAVRHVHAKSLPYKDSLNVDKVLQRRYRDALIAVYNATVFGARDTVVNTYNIHTNNTPGLNAVEILAPDTVYWMEELFNNTPPTTNTTIAYYYTKYNMQYVYYQAQPYDKVVFSTDSNLNMVVLRQKFSTLPGAISAAVVQPFSDARNIVDTLDPNYIQLSYSYGWGTCLDTCDHRRFWTFKVTTDCKIDYKGESGDALNTSVNKLSAGENFFTVFPNPSSGKLTLKSDHLLAEAIIRNSVGQELRKVHLNSQASEIDISDLSAGFYFLTVSEHDFQRTIKVIKE